VGEVRLAYTSWKSAGRYFAGSDIALLPVGSTEQHGPHNPLGTDHLIAYALALEAGRRTGVVVLPPVPFGVSAHHSSFPGTVWVREEVFKEYVRDVILSLKRHGVRKVVVVNGHGGNLSALLSLARELRGEGVLAVVARAIAARVFSILFFNFLFRKFYFQSTLGRVYKAPVRPEPVSRAGNAVRGHAVRGPEPRALEQGVVPLNAWARLLLELCGDPRCGGGRWAQALQRVRVVRTDTLRLLTTPEIDDFLRRVGDATARLINMENFRRRHLFFEGRGIDCSWMSAWSRRFTDYFDIYKLLGSKNFAEACRLIGEQWKSFLGLLKAAKEGKLEPWQKVRPPGYRKDKDGQRIPIVVVRYDNYRVDLERKVIRLGYWNIEVPFTGKPRWLTKQGAKLERLIITYDPVKKRWYARISVEVTLERKFNHGLKAGIDLGRERLIAFVTEPLSESGEGVALLYRGEPLKSDYFYFERKIAEVDKMLSDPKLEEADRSVLKEVRRRFYERRKRRRDQVFANAAAHLIRVCEELGVAVLLLGYPRGVARDKPGKGNTNMWSYRGLAQRIAVTAENRGIPAFEVPEDGTSKTCARHGCEVQRGPRGLVRCPHGHVMHADLNAAMNILARGGGRVPTRVRVLSFIPTASKVIAVNEKNSNPA
jgi:putative transposase